MKYFLWLPLLCALAFGQGVTILPKTTILPKSTVFPGTASGGATTTSRIFNGTSDFLNSVATVDLSTSSNKQLSVVFWLNWTTNANNDHLAGEFSANYNSNNGGFLLDINQSSPTGTAGFNVHTTGGNFLTCNITRPSAGALHKYAVAWDISVNPNTCAVWLDGVAQSPTVNSNTDTGGTFGNYTIYLMSRGGTTLFGAGTMSRFSIYLGHLLTNTEGQNLTSTSTCTSPTTLGSNVVYLPFNGVSPETDSSGNGHSFTVTGTTTGSQTCP
jgi:hypothetical protein